MGIGGWSGGAGGEAKTRVTLRQGRAASHQTGHQGALLGQGWSGHSCRHGALSVWQGLSEQRAGQQGETSGPAGTSAVFGNPHGVGLRGQAGASSRAQAYRAARSGV